MKKAIYILLAICISNIIYGQDLIIKNPTIIPMHVAGKIEGKSVRIKAGKIIQIAPFSKIKKVRGIKIIDAKGQYLMPGLADMHVHLTVNNQLDSLLKTSLKAGVTQI
ncbi:hypothetical protein V7S79_00165 [Aquirufa sp. ROCK-SH2]